MALVAMWVKWMCDRCHREVVLESIVLDTAKAGFNVRCPLCEMLTRFVTPTRSEFSGITTDTSVVLTRSEVPPTERH